MKNKIATILKDINILIQEKELGILDIYKDIPIIINLLETAFEDLKVVVSDYVFENTTAEIYFFKECKPKLFSKLIYYSKVYTIEMRRPTCSLGVQKNYLEEEQNRIKTFFS